MDISAQMLIFATIVERGSISAAARSVGQAPSAVSKQIGLLEDQVHYRLLNRTRTGVSPTQEGQEFYEKCKAMADKFKEAEALILNFDGVPRGNLKIVCSVPFGKSQLIPALPKSWRRTPKSTFLWTGQTEKSTCKAKVLMQPFAFRSSAKTPIS